MLRKPFFSFSLFVVLAVMLASLSQAHLARAQKETPVAQTKCRTCHEDLYYLYDTGKWYCLCGRQRICTDCHNGNADTMDVKLAHEGVIENPIQENSAACQDCHPEEAEARIAKFSMIAGIDPEATPAIPISSDNSRIAGSQANPPTSSMLQAEPMATWRIAALGLVGLALIGILAAGYRCWKADCLRKIPQGR
jgi:hypothetical protein